LVALFLGLAVCLICAVRVKRFLAPILEAQNEYKER
jgi:hypothetical protein